MEIETTMLTGPTNMDSSTRCTSRFAFTLVELLVTIVILSILSSLVLFAMTGALETAKIQQTKTRIAKLDRELSRMWNGYLSRRVPIRFKRPTAGSNVVTVDDWQNESYRMARQQGRLVALRDLMRLEIPDRKTDVTGDVYPGAVDFNGDGIVDERDRPLLSRAYHNLASKTQWTAKFQGAECLYMILTVNAGTGSRGRPFLSENEMGDVDGDGMPEILDAWGEPIRFLRWAPGFSRPLAAPPSAPIQHFSPIQVADPSSAPDPFDPRGIYAKYALYPLIISAGPDKKWDMAFTFGTDQLHYADPKYATANDPFRDWSLTAADSLLGLVGDDDLLGLVGDDDDVGNDNFVDNLYNHLMETSTN